MSRVAIIGGSGLTSLPGLTVTGQHESATPYGKPSGPVIIGEYADREIIFLPRHGSGHTIPPHRVNYRANLWVLHSHKADRVIGINAVGGITAAMAPGDIVIPHQIIDYTWSRAHTYFDSESEPVTHIDFTSPYDETLRRLLIEQAHAINLKITPLAVYGATQGPRLETAAEIDRMERDGCDIVGMTGMPEAALARELGLAYASISMVANPAAGRSTGVITMDEIEKNIASAMGKVHALLQCVLTSPRQS